MPYCPNCNDNGVNLPGEVCKPCCRFHRFVFIIGAGVFVGIAVIAVALTRSDLISSDAQIAIDKNYLR